MRHLQMILPFRLRLTPKAMENRATGIAHHEESATESSDAAEDIDGIAGMGFRVIARGGMRSLLLVPGSGHR